MKTHQKTQKLVWHHCKFSSDVPQKSWVSHDPFWYSVLWNVWGNWGNEDWALMLGITNFRAGRASLRCPALGPFDLRIHQVQISRTLILVWTNASTRSIRYIHRAPSICRNEGLALVVNKGGVEKISDPTNFLIFKIASQEISFLDLFGRSCT